MISLLTLEDRAELGLFRFSASQGLDAFERAEPVSADRMLGWSPVVTILDANAAGERCRWKGFVMPPIRFRIRTSLIGIAVLAVLFVTVRILADRSRFYRASATIDGPNVKIGIEWLSRARGDFFPPDAGHIDWIVDQNVRMPLCNLAVLAFGIVGILAIAYRYRTNRRRLDKF